MGCGFKSLRFWNLEFGIFDLDFRFFWVVFDVKKNLLTQDLKHKNRNIIFI